MGPGNLDSVLITRSKISIFACYTHIKKDKVLVEESCKTARKIQSGPQLEKIHELALEKHGESSKANRSHPSCKCRKIVKSPTSQLWAVVLRSWAQRNEILD